VYSHNKSHASLRSGIIDLLSCFQITVEKLTRGSEAGQALIWSAATCRRFVTPVKKNSKALTTPTLKFYPPLFAR
jgi:hypothetical protein